MILFVIKIYFLLEWWDICIHATMTNPRVSEIYRPWLEAYQQRNPNAPRLMYTVVLALDGVEIEVPKSKDPYLQARTYSSKSSINALGKLFFSMMDGIARFVAICTATSSPAATDERNHAHMIFDETHGGCEGGVQSLIADVPEYIHLVVLMDKIWYQFGRQQGSINKKKHLEL